MMPGQRYFLVFLLAASLNGCATVTTPPAPGEEQGPRVTAIESIADLSGDWLVQDGSVERVITLDCEGAGDYQWQDGTIRTTKLDGRSWHGTWHQAANDREGGFLAELSEDGSRAEGRWWYSRIGTDHLPSKDKGGPFSLERLESVRHPTASPCAMTNKAQGSEDSPSASYAR